MKKLRAAIVFDVLAGLRLLADAAQQASISLPGYCHRRATRAGCYREAL
jgi:hypothetical protein